MKAEIISIGTELLLGQIIDTNSAYLAGELPLLGMDLYWISTVGDNQARIVEVLKRAWQRSDLILTTGGLGPTEDDLTRESIAELLGEKLEQNSALEAELRQFFIHRGIEMAASNLKQTTLIRSSQPISNARGTAPGWWVSKNGHLLLAMPGPPGEMQPMWQKEILPRLRRMSSAVIVSRTVKTYGLSESTVGEMISPLFSLTNPTMGIYAKTDGIHLRLTAKSGTPEEAQAAIAKREAEVKAIMGDHVWGFDNDTVESIVSHSLIEKKLSVGVMEDYTGGCLAMALSDIHGSEAFFRGSLSAISSTAKLTLGMDASNSSNVATPELAQAMAEAARRALGADIGLGVTVMEVANSGQTGIVYVSITGGRSVKLVNRTQTRARVTMAALHELRKFLLGRDKTESG